MIRGIYLHIPFCGRKCPYCDFNTFTGMEQRIPRYMEALRQELELHARCHGDGSSGGLESVYFGGGTPSLLPPEQVAATLATIDDLFGVTDNTELSFEVNPGTVDLERLQGYRAAGIKRLSIGCQSFRPEQLIELGRDHSVEDTMRTLEQVQQAGFESMSVDLMYGVSGQTEEHWRADLDAALSCGATHLSLYNLSIEAGTPFAKRREAGLLPLPPEESLRTMYLLALQRTAEQGFERYEVSNFARRGHQCVHNRLYWEGRSWLGVGAGAHGFIAGTGLPHFGRRWWNLRSPQSYIREVEAGRLPEDGSEDIGLQKAVTEEFLLSLRTSDGLQRARFLSRFGFDAVEFLGAGLDPLIEEGVLEVNERSIAITQAGVIITDYIIERLSREFDSRSGSAIVGRFASQRRAAEPDSGYRNARSSSQLQGAEQNAGK